MDVIPCTCMIRRNIIPSCMRLKAVIYVVSTGVYRLAEVGDDLRVVDWSELALTCVLFFFFFFLVL